MRGSDKIKDRCKDKKNRCQETAVRYQRTKMAEIQKKQRTVGLERHRCSKLMRFISQGDPRIILTSHLVQILKGPQSLHEQSSYHFDRH